MKKIEQINYFNEECFKLTNELVECIVCPKDGMNIYGIWYKGRSLILFDEERKKIGATYGVPILFPTPNRVRENAFCWEGKTVPAKMHGFCKNLRFDKTGECISSNEVVISGKTLIEKGMNEFPFSCILHIKISLIANQLKYEYEIENIGEDALPYGFALHPFFSNEWKQSTIQINAEKIMKMTEDQLPTGEVEANFMKGKALQIEELRLDHVFTELTNPSAVFTTQGVEITLVGDENFTHLVVYTPENKNFFCVEPQTCSTDSHNLYALGYKKESGLLIVEPKESKRGQINFYFKESDVINF